MKTKIKEALACLLFVLCIGLVIYVVISVSCGTMTRLKGLSIMGISAVPTFIYAYKIEEEK